jgi:hypothetical protein
MPIFNTAHVVVKYNWHLLHWVGYNHSTEHFSEGTWFAEQAASFEKALQRHKLL